MKVLFGELFMIQFAAVFLFVIVNTLQTISHKSLWIFSRSKKLEHWLNSKYSMLHIKDQWPRWKRSLLMPIKTGEGFFEFVKHILFAMIFVPIIGWYLSAIIFVVILVISLFFNSFIIDWQKKAK